MVQSEWHRANAYVYNRASALRWIVSHVWRYRWYALTTLVCFIGAWVVYSQARVEIGVAAGIIEDPSSGSLTATGLRVMGLLLADSILMLIGSFAAENVAARVQADARDELYTSLLGKSQTYHDRQRVGDLMARATDDMDRIGDMLVPGTTLVYEAVLGVIVPFVFIGLIDPVLLIVPIGFFIAYVITVRLYMKRLEPVISAQREQFGTLNAGLEETIAGIEVVKASAREDIARHKFRNDAQVFRDLFVKQGQIEARYLPLFFYGIGYALFLGQAFWMYSAGTLPLSDVIGGAGLMWLLRFPTFISIFAFSVLQAGYASSKRVLEVINAKTDVDQNSGGHAAEIAGAITLEHVRFGYGEKAVLSAMSFAIKPGQTVAIVGQTGSGKSALTQIINRTYDVWDGRVLIDGVDVRDWNLDALRSQIAKIEQDVFLFSRTIGENIAFGAPDASQAEIEAAAQAAQAHGFISELPEGYGTVIGERGVTLSGGQRQRIALARAFLRNPRILILDDSTSAVDSETEDQIQKALRHAQEGRTTLLITHRMSQIRWADLILVLDKGQIVAQGDHETLLRTSAHYRRIFARYTDTLPPLEATEAEAVAA